ncbi:hypothetical protein MPL3365_230044 [Mesorhizobium plurifarium]|uniref:Uncharacterized protein n=1 Tax=Mesorhizobium plurifarium TaxID=69974 RepID=A0A090GUE0_MESPL|nr:hypothetical protein MPL3365_230044 [Mesorhizobium plurifarium]
MKIFASGDQGLSSSGHRNAQAVLGRRYIPGVPLRTILSPSMTRSIRSWSVETLLAAAALTSASESSGR